MKQAYYTRTGIQNKILFKHSSDGYNYQQKISANANKILVAKFQSVKSITLEMCSTQFQGRVATHTLDLPRNYGNILNSYCASSNLAETVVYLKRLSRLQ